MQQQNMGEELKKNKQNGLTMFDTNEAIEPGSMNELESRGVSDFVNDFFPNEESK